MGIETVMTTHCTANDVGFNGGFRISSDMNFSIRLYDVIRPSICLITQLVWKQQVMQILSREDGSTMLNVHTKYGHPFCANK